MRDFTVATAVSPEPHPFSRAVFPAAASLVIHNTTGQAITADNHRRDQLIFSCVIRNYSLLLSML